MILSGQKIRLTSMVQNAAGARLDVGTEAMVVTTERDSDPKIYRCETLENDQFEQEEFFCFADNFELVERSKEVA